MKNTIKHPVFIIFAFMMLSAVGITMAQQQQIDENKVVKVEITVKEAALILDALGSKPYNEIAPLMGKIQGQVMKQLQEQPDKK